MKNYKNAPIKSRYTLSIIDGDTGETLHTISCVKKYNNRELNEIYVERASRRLFEEFQNASIKDDQEKSKEICSAFIKMNKGLQKVNRKIKA